MGQEIPQTRFEDSDFAAFGHKLAQETRLLERLMGHGALSACGPVAGFELEAWLLDAAMRPSPCNQAFLATLNDPLASPELAKFNIELNGHPIALAGDVFRQMHRQLQNTWDRADNHARGLGKRILMIGILPTLQQTDLTLGNISDMHRYKALNEQILQARGKPVHIDIGAAEHLRFDHDDVMLESATTSFQLHTQLPLTTAHHFYNASIIASAAVVAVCANSPFLFGKALWQETRIPLFEQAIETGGYDGVAHGPLHRVSFGSDFARQSIFECFQENLAHFPVLLPVLQDTPTEAFAHLRLHNGTIWRWNRPLVGFDEDGTPHIRVEHRTPAAGPTVIDAVANAAFYYGLAQNLCDEIMTQGLPLAFAQAKDNFYQAARHGLGSVIVWTDGGKHRMDQLLKAELVDRAHKGLQSLGVTAPDIDEYLGIVRDRILSNQTGSQWQRRFIKEHPHDFSAMTAQYLRNQQIGNPVGTWAIE